MIRLGEAKFESLRELKQSGLVNPLRRCDIEADVSLEDVRQLSHIDDFWPSFCEKHGVDALLDLSRDLGGREIYIPSFNSVIRRARNRAIANKLIDQKGLNLSKRQVRILISAIRKGAFE